MNVYLFNNHKALGRFREYITHPVFISIVLWFAAILFIPPLFERFHVNEVSDEYTGLKNKLHFFDLDGDRTSEMVHVDYNEKMQTKIQVSKGNKVHDQYDLKHHPAQGDYAFAGDYDLDGNKEIYFFTQTRDSIFLSVIDPVIGRNIMVSGRYIDLKGKAPQSDDTPMITSPCMITRKDGRNSDLFFIINSGYSLKPRNVYRYMVSEDSLLRSPLSAAALTGYIVEDMNGDTLPEFILQVMSPGNYDKTSPYTDHLAWLMVLNDSLNFIFPPVSFHEHPSRLLAVPLKLESGTFLVVLHDYFGTGNFHPSLNLFDAKGNRVSEWETRNLEGLYSYIFKAEKKPKHTFYLLKNRKGEVEELDAHFQTVHSFKIPGVESGKPIALIDANLDGEEEYIFAGERYESLVIVQHDFKDAVSWNKANLSKLEYITQVYKADASPLLYLQFPDHGLYIRFGKNPAYYLKLPFYMALFLVILLFVVIMARIQRYRLQMQQETEKKMADLQMRAIRNQLDPHFTLNILNAIGGLYVSEKNRQRADYIFGKYARLIRQTVISSDQTIITLEEEIDFVKNYIDLEQFRCNNTFDFTLHVGENVNLQTKIPRMLIHTFVENAIKYGIRTQSDKGLLRISIELIDRSYRILVEDNGPGLYQQENHAEKGTGKGLLILRDIIELYYKLERIRITYSLQNVYLADGKVGGTRAVVELPMYG